MEKGSETVSIIYTDINIYIYIERERDRERQRDLYIQWNSI
jgi:hypothetical protein